MSIKERLEDKGWNLFDIQITLTLNPLNWGMSYTHYFKGCKQITFGPVSIILYYGGGNNG